MFNVVLYYFVSPDRICAYLWTERDSAFIAFLLERTVGCGIAVSFGSVYFDPAVHYPECSVEWVR